MSVYMNVVHALVLRFHVLEHFVCSEGENVVSRCDDNNEHTIGAHTAGVGGRRE